MLSSSSSSSFPVLSADEDSDGSDGSPRWVSKDLCNERGTTLWQMGKSTWNPSNKGLMMEKVMHGIHYRNAPHTRRLPHVCNWILEFSDLLDDTVPSGDGPLLERLKSFCQQSTIPKLTECVARDIAELEDLVNDHFADDCFPQCLDWLLHNLPIVPLGELFYTMMEQRKDETALKILQDGQNLDLLHDTRLLESLFAIACLKSSDTLVREILKYLLEILLHPSD
jgi:hypothetical protein